MFEIFVLSQYDSTLDEEVIKWSKEQKILAVERKKAMEEAAREAARLEKEREEQRKKLVEKIALERK